MDKKVTGVRSSLRKSALLDGFISIVLLVIVLCSLWDPENLYVPFQVTHLWAAFLITLGAYSSNPQLVRVVLFSSMLTLLLDATSMCLRIWRFVVCTPGNGDLCSSYVLKNATYFILLFFMIVTEVRVTVLLFGYLSLVRANSRHNGAPEYDENGYSQLQDDHISENGELPEDGSNNASRASVRMSNLKPSTASKNGSVRNQYSVVVDSPISKKGKAAFKLGSSSNVYNV